MDLCANNYQISTEKGTKYEIELSSKTDRDRGSCHFCSVMTSPKLLICTSMIKFRKSCSFRVFFKAVFNLKHGEKNSQLIGFNKIKSLIYNITLCQSLPCHCSMLSRNENSAISFFSSSRSEKLHS